MLRAIVLVAIALPAIGIARADANQTRERWSCYDRINNLQRLGDVVAIQWPSDLANPTLVVGGRYRDVPKNVRDIIPHQVNCILTGAHPTACVDFDVRDTSGNLIDRWRSCALQ